jgi:hypothetical protein
MRTPLIPDERCYASRDPESRNTEQIERLLDPGSHPAPRDLAGMTNATQSLTGEGQGGADSLLHPPPAPPIKGGEFKRMPFVPTLMNG